MPSDRPSEPSKSRDLCELFIGYALILSVIWTPRPWQRILYIATLLVLIAIIWRSFTTLAAMGLRSANFLRSLWVAAIAAAISAISIFSAYRLHTLHAPHNPVLFFKTFWGYALWSFAQQILLLDFFLRRLLRLLPTSALASVAAAVLFSTAHLPNLILTIITLLLGLAACFLFLRYRNLWPLAIAHALLGITIAIAIPSPLVRNMRVGLGYLRYHPPSAPLSRTPSH
jgi:membrane protease YdiL (CAAX protease family)